ncbi:MAG TPA: glycosyl hydrolase family 28 protein [Polyangiaceae bacterium]|nr:glycosyl hydrolase family 28 protein [Polyangiaceae bacterium]
MRARLAAVLVVLGFAASQACGGKSAAIGDSGAGGPGSSGSGGSSSPGGGGSSGGSNGSSGSGTSSSSGGSSGGSSSSSSAGLGADASSTGDAASGACGAGDPNLPAEPTIPPACTTLSATQAVASGTLPSESSPDTVSIQSALNSCATGHAVRLATSGANNAFITGPINLPDGVFLWVDTGVTLYGSRNATVYGTTCGTSGGSCSPLIASNGANNGIVGAGTIDGQGGEEILNQTQSWWDLTGSTDGASANPTLIHTAAATNFTLYGITLQNSPKFHVTLDAAGFVVWGITINTPSKTMNAQGEALTPSGAHNTDGIDPGESASNGFIVCSTISDGDDHIALKGGTSVNGITIAHNHFGAGHGMSIGSETNGGVSNVMVYDLSIDGTNSGLGGGSSNGIRIKSDSDVGGLVNNITYSDVCVRDIANPILLTPRYTTATGTSIPEFTGITISDFRSVASSVTPTVTIDGYDSAHITGLTLDNVVVDGITAANVSATNANITLGPGNVNFTPSGTNVTVTDDIMGTSQPNQCSGKFVTLPGPF